jgi:hypothetical protein
MILAFAWGSEEKYENPVRIVSVLTKIRTVHLPNANYMCYCFSQLAQYFQGRRVKVIYVRNSDPNNRHMLISPAGKVLD